MPTAIPARAPRQLSGFVLPSAPYEGPSALELARLLPRGSWTLVGGLMVSLHAALAGLPMPRATVDVDSTLHLETGAITFASAAATLYAAGYALDESTAHAYRFDRGLDRVDLMCSDRQLAFRRPRYGRRPLFGVPGGTRALQQTIDVDMVTASGGVRMVIPSLRGALVLKGAAYLEDARGRTRHAEDAVILMACMQTAPWATHDGVVQALAREALGELAERLHA